MLEIKDLNFEDLTDDQASNVPNNGCGKEYANYIKVFHNGVLIALESDAMEPEDVRFYRDLGWIGPLLKTCYELGVKDGEMK